VIIAHGNFVNLADEEKRAYENRVVTFFLTHLPITSGPVVPTKTAKAAKPAH
jgi:hypothetical protein